MNTLTQRILILAFLGAALLFLPACGSKGNVKSGKATETVLNPESSSNGTADIGMPGENRNTPINTYVEKIKRNKGSKSSKMNSLPGTNPSTPAMTTQTTPNQTPSMETPVPVAKKSGGSHWLWWLLLVLVLGGIGWYFWSKNQSSDYNQPNPPVGGLSPVSGFTGVKDNIEDVSEPETSFWSKKLF